MKIISYYFQSKSEEYLTVNYPNDEKTVRATFRNKKYLGSKIDNKTHDKNPIVVYYLNEIHKLQAIFDFFENTVYKNECKPIKIMYILSSIRNSYN